MTLAVATAPASRLPGPPGLLPGLPDAIVDLQDAAGAALVGATWRTAPARVAETDFVALAGPGAPDPLGPGQQPNRTYEVLPRAHAADFDDTTWEVLAPQDTLRRLANGRVCFQWYRIAVTIPERLGTFDPTGATIVFEVVVDDYAEIWVDGALPLSLGMAGGPVVAGFNAPNRVVLTRDARPGQRFQLAIFGINGPISAAPPNYIWLRTATLDFYAAERARPSRPAAMGVVERDARLAGIVGEAPELELLAEGFESTAGPVWAPDGALLFSSPTANAIYRLAPELGQVSVFRPKSGYAGIDAGELVAPGSAGLAYDPQGRLAICQRGNRRVVRVNPHGDLTVLAAAAGGRPLEGPRDITFRSDGTLFFSDPSCGLVAIREGEPRVLRGVPAHAAGIALSPDENRLYTADGGALLCCTLDDARAPATVCELGEEPVAAVAVDAAGSIYAGGPGGIWVLAGSGEPLGRLELPEAPTGLAWGDGDRRALYVTTETSIYRMRVRIPGGIR
jgi:gluconolactonase